LSRRAEEGGGGDYWWGCPAIAGGQFFLRGAHAAFIVYFSSNTLLHGSRKTNKQLKHNIKTRVCTGARSAFTTPAPPPRGRSPLPPPL
jgi:hypothetical protein